MIDVLVVVFHPNTTQLKALLESVLHATNQGVPLAMRVWHNDGDAPLTGEVSELYRAVQQRGLTLTIGGGE